PRVFSAYGLVTFACSAFKAFAVQNIDLAARIDDELGALQDFSSQGNRRATCAQHLRQELMGQWKAVQGGPVLAEEQPAGQALFNVVYPVAGGGIGNLHQMALKKAAAKRAQCAW